MKLYTCFPRVVELDDEERVSCLSPARAQQRLAVRFLAKRPEARFCEMRRQAIGAHANASVRWTTAGEVSLVHRTHVDSNNEVVKGAVAQRCRAVAN